MGFRLSDSVLGRFAGLTNWQLQCGDAPPSTIPPYFGLLLAAMDSSLDSPLCFVFPRRGEVARVASILYALHSLVSDFDSLPTRGPGPLKIGDRVRVNPSGEIFRFGGPVSGAPGRVWLQVGLSRDRLQFRETEMSRLERTESPGEPGSLATSLSNPPIHPLDLLIERDVYGRASFARRHLAVLDAKGEFDTFYSSTRLHNPPVLADGPTFDVLLPVGDAGAVGRSTRVGPGALIARTYDAEVLAEYCLDAPSRSLLVIVNGLARLSGQLQAYDDIRETQRLVIFSDQSEADDMEAIAQRGCRFWSMREDEIVCDGLALSGSLALVEKAARHSKNLALCYESCAHRALEDAFFWLQTLKGSIGEGDDGPIAQLLARSWWLFLEANRQVEGIPPAEAHAALVAIGQLASDVRGYSSFLPSEAATAWSGFADSLTECWQPASKLGESKGAALYHCLSTAMSSGRTIALLVDLPRHTELLTRWLAKYPRLQGVAVVPLRELADDSCFDEAVLSAWPGGAGMRRLIAHLAAPRVTVVGYQWEDRWLKQSAAKLRPRPTRMELTDSEKAAMLSVAADEGLERVPDLISPSSAAAEAAPILDAFEFEHRLRGARIGLAARPTDAVDTQMARYVRFSGNFYAFLTESHKLPIANALLSRRSQQRLPEEVISRIAEGDFVVFPESGDHELLTELADRVMGASAGDARKAARLWKEVLIASRMTPDHFCARAKDLGYTRQLPTVRRWFAQTSQIGPRDKDDLVLISVVTNSSELERSANKVLDAIEKVRGAHQSAGIRLREQLIGSLPDAVIQLDDERTHVSLGDLGSAWIVRVEGISATPEPRGRNEINRLLEAHSSRLIWEA